jgi:hypothetical protein
MDEPQVSISLGRYIFFKEQEGPEPLLKFIKKKVQKSTAQRLQQKIILDL